MDAAIAPSDIILILIPTKCKTKKVKHKVTGMVSKTTKLARHERKKTIITKIAKNKPS